MAPRSPSHAGAAAPHAIAIATHVIAIATHVIVIAIGFASEPPPPADF